MLRKILSAAMYRTNPCLQFFAYPIFHYLIRLSVHGLYRNFRTFRDLLLQKNHRIGGFCGAKLALSHLQTGSIPVNSSIFL